MTHSVKAIASPTVSGAFRMLGFAWVIAICCWWSIVHARGPYGLSTLWVASGVLCGVLLTSPRSRWPGVLAVAFMASTGVNMAINGVSWTAFWFSMANTMDAWLVAWITSRYVADPSNLLAIRRSVGIAAIATLAACALSALLASGVRSLMENSPAPFPVLYRTWLGSHATGMAIFATLAITARVEGQRMLGTAGTRIELAATLAVIGVASYWIFWRADPGIPFPLFPLLLLCVFRHRFAGFVFACAIVSVIATMGTAAGHGPFQVDGDTAGMHRALILQFFIASICLVTFPTASILTERRLLASRVAKSERDYRLLADNSTDIIGRISTSHGQDYISPSVATVLGWSTHDYLGRCWELVHPEDATAVRRCLDSVWETGIDATALYRMRHRDGCFRWIEIKVRRIEEKLSDGSHAIVYFGRDVSERIEAHRELEANHRRLRAITDNLPAVVLRVDRDQRYTFANAYAGTVLGMNPEAIPGHTILDLLGPEIHAESVPRVQAVLEGQTVRFEMDRQLLGQRMTFQSTYVPDLDADGQIQGFFAVSFDITPIKEAERKLERLARFDSLTGLANRLHFNERLEQAILRLHRTGHPLALLYLDIDRFKQINDTLGHAAGDDVLREFAQRVTHCIRATDFPARLGGDEFVILVEDLSSETAPQAIANKLVDAMTQPIRAGDSSIITSTSIGIAFGALSLTGATELMQLADQALYAAKAAGRNTWRTAGTESPSAQPTT